ncbi:MAG: DNA translocase FtsK [Eubacteriales bacterium]|nr:DNA translocase FtsK [Eubacteriales bacterium]
MAKKAVDHRKEITGIFYMAAALIMAAAYYLGDRTGIMGKFLREAGHGLVGITAYAIPVLLLYMALDYFIEREGRVTRVRLFYVTILIITVSAIIHVFAVPYDAFKEFTARSEGGLTAFNGLKQLWKTGITGFEDGSVKTPLTGGLIGGSAAFAFVSVANKVGALIILFMIALTEIVLVFNISISKAISRTREKMDSALKHTVENIRESAARMPEISGDYDMVVGDEKATPPDTKAGLFGLPKFLQDDKKSKAETADKKKAPLDVPVEMYNVDEHSTENDLWDTVTDPNVDLPAGIKHVGTGIAGTGSVSGAGIAVGAAAGVRRVSIPEDKHSDKLVNDTEDPDNSGNESEGTLREDERPERPYVFPSPELLNSEGGRLVKNDMFAIQSLGRKLEKTLESFGIQAKVINITNGPVITRFELTPGSGVKVSKIVSLADDIALNLAATGVRIEAPIPGKSAIGIEIPNNEILPVSLRRLIESPEFNNASSPLTAVLGRDIPGNPVICDLARMPHLLIAGATGSGKSVCLNSILISMLFKASPKEVKLLMIDPKVVELSVYNGIPHLLVPVVTNPKKAANTLQWAVNEMTRRYALFAEQSVREVQAYNAAAESQGYEKLPLILVVIDELSDLMATSANEVEDAIARLTAMARAAGMHLIIATQRPSVDVITGVIKANIPSRISFAVSSQVDSRTILDTGGAEKLLGKGDMLYFPVGASKPMRAQGAYVTDKEVERVTDFVKKQNSGGYDKATSEAINTSSQGGAGSNEDTQTDEDELFPDAVSIVVEAGYASISLLQRRMNVGYPRAARLIDRMQEKGFIGGFEGSKPRKVLVSKDQWAEYRTREGV